MPNFNFFSPNFLQAKIYRKSKYSESVSNHENVFPFIFLVISKNLNAGWAEVTNSLENVVPLFTKSETWRKDFQESFFCVCVTYKVSIQLPTIKQDLDYFKNNASKIRNRKNSFNYMIIFQKRLLDESQYDRLLTNHHL